jgi:hypothetical protein
MYIVLLFRGFEIELIKGFEKNVSEERQRTDCDRLKNCDVCAHGLGFYGLLFRPFGLIRGSTHSPTAGGVVSLKTRPPPPPSKEGEDVLVNFTR